MLGDRALKAHGGECLVFNTGPETAPSIWAQRSLKTYAVSAMLLSPRQSSNGLLQVRVRTRCAAALNHCTATADGAPLERAMSVARRACARKAMPSRFTEEVTLYGA